PQCLSVKARGLHVHGLPVAEARAGRRVAVNVSGVDVSDVTRGDTLCEPRTFETTRRVDVTLDLLSDARALRHGARVRLHQGTSELLGRVAIAGPRAGAGGVAEVPPGGTAYARIRLERPAVVTRGDRFIIRAYSPPQTVGGGEILDPHPPRTAIRTSAGLTRFCRLSEDTEQAVAWMIAERGASGLPRRALVSRAGLTRDAATAVEDRLARSGRAIVADDCLVGSGLVEDLAGRLLAMVQAHHESQPLSEGLSREEARVRVFDRAAPFLFDFTVGRLVADARLIARERLTIPGHQVSLTPEDARARTALESVFREARLSPPDVTAAAAAAGTTPEAAERLVKLLLKSGTLVRVDTLLFHRDVLEAIKAQVKALKAGPEAPRVDVATFKERYGLSRKYAIPLLEYLDRERITRRVGDGRIVL
ncbi:MAG TPA: SelB C-terminal domain-containing protein, partial [Vicinamibacterales bacterium]|nr:SelB C-terminal domain-containing protein [Vicinamibacterales bacterium]